MIYYHLEFTNGSNLYTGFSDDLDKWKVNYLIEPVPGHEGFYTARQARGRVYRSKITRKRDRYGCYHYEYQLIDKVLHFETYDKLSSLEALQELSRSYPEILLED